MAQCKSCGKKTFFFNLSGGLCKVCLENARQEAIKGKVFVVPNWQPHFVIYDRHRDQWVDEVIENIKKLIRGTSIADNRETARLIVEVIPYYEDVAQYTDGSMISRVLVDLRITDNKNNVLFYNSFAGESPNVPGKIYRRPNEAGQRIAGPCPMSDILKYMDSVLRVNGLHKSCPPRLDELPPRYK